MTQSWIDARILIRSATSDGYPVEIEGPGGTFADGYIPLETSVQVKQQWEQLEATRPYGHSLESETVTRMRTLGQYLYNALNGDDNRLERALDRRLVPESTGIRLQLRIRDTEVRTWPWELLCEKGTSTHEDDNSESVLFFVLSSKMLVSRYHEQSIPIPNPEHVARLRILVIIAMPQDYGPLDRVAKEELVALRLIGSCNQRIDLTVLEHASPETLLSHLTKAERPYHIVHFIGHGYAEASSPHTPARTGIVLETIDGHGIQIDAAAFARLLIESQNDVLRRRKISINARFGTYPHLITLDACHSARAEINSVASELMDHGVPATIGMQSTVSPAFVILFTSGVYTHLIDGWPIDQAVAETRRAMQQHFNRTTEWHIPMLSVRATDGVLFAFSTESAETKRWLANLERFNDLAGAEASHVTIELLKLGATAIPLLVAAVLMAPLAAVRAGAAIALRRLITKPEIYTYVVQLIVPAMDQEIDPEVRGAIARILAQPRIDGTVELAVKRLASDRDPQVRTIARAGREIQKAFADATTDAEVIVMLLNLFTSAFEDELLQRIERIQQGQDQVASEIVHLVERVSDVLTQWMELQANRQKVPDAEASLQALALFLLEAKQRAAAMNDTQVSKRISPEVDRMVAATNRALASGRQADQATLTLLKGLRLAHDEAYEIAVQQQAIIEQINQLTHKLSGMTITNGRERDNGEYTIYINRKNLNSRRNDQEPWL